MKTDSYIPWVKAVNIELTKFDECLSCFDITTNGNLERWFVEQFTPEAAATEIHFLRSLKKNKCMCAEKNIKNPASSLDGIIKSARM